MGEFELKKHKYNKTIIVLKEGIEVDQIHYDTIEDLCNILEKYYSNELLCEKEGERV